MSKAVFLHNNLSILITFDYPCGTIDITADPELAEIDIKLKELYSKNLLGVEPLQNSHLKPGVLERYYAFQLGKIYNHEHMVITSRRIVSSGILTSHQFILKCQDDGVKVSQIYSAGEPRLLSIGAGANTDVGPIFKIAWKNLTTGEYDSTLGTSLFLSLREQTLRLNSAWYLLDRPSRFHLSPVLTLSRENEDIYETLSSELALLSATSYDNQIFGLWASLGPAFKYDRQYEGIAPVVADYYGVRGDIRLEGHKFEYWKHYPREDHMLNANIFTAQASRGTPFRATILRAQSQHLFNFKNRVPPWLILGIRSKVNMTFTSLGADQSFILPTYFRHFLGGLSDIRGFSRKDIPGDSLGGLGTAYIGLEAGSDAILHEKLRPFLFFDLGAVGEQSHQLDMPLYHSPGVGMRWESPIGALRLNLARGFISEGFNGPTFVANPLQVHVSLGEEF